jgi:hypothetical protein
MVDSNMTCTHLAEIYFPETFFGDSGGTRDNYLNAKLLRALGQ